MRIQGPHFTASSDRYHAAFLYALEGAIQKKIGVPSPLKKKDTTNNLLLSCASTQEILRIKADPMRRKTDVYRV